MLCDGFKFDMRRRMKEIKSCYIQFRDQMVKWSPEAEVEKLRTGSD